MAKVSVIIPVYNTAKYLPEALDSIINQTLQDIEIITINDGSNDNSLQILNDYAQRDSRIKVFSQENSGVAKARNVGMEYAKGDYIYFFDSDDILLPSCLQECLCKCQEYNLDFCFFDANIFYEGKAHSFPYDYKRYHLLEDRVYGGLEIIKVLNSLDKFRVSPCLHLIRKEFIESLNLRYESISHEDELFITKLYLAAQRVAMVPKVFFKRRVRENSSQTSPYKKGNLQAYLYIVDSLRHLQEQKSKEYVQVVDKLSTNIVSAAVYRANVLDVATRFWCLQRVVCKYWRFCSAKSMLVCAFPFLIRHTK
jgi:Glycosyltransferases involved in cell wall biogenesis